MQEPDPVLIVDCYPNLGGKGGGLRDTLNIFSLNMSPLCRVLYSNDTKLTPLQTLEHYLQTSLYYNLNFSNFEKLLLKNYLIDEPLKRPP